MNKRENVISDLELQIAWIRDNDFHKFPGWGHAVLAMRDALALLKEQEPPAVDAAPVVHARWINYPECLGYEGAYLEENIVCSACHSVWNVIDNDADRFDYCPACGAKMDGDVNG